MLGWGSAAQSEGDSAGAPKRLQKSGLGKEKELWASVREAPGTAAHSRRHYLPPFLHSLSLLASQSSVCGCHWAEGNFQALPTWAKQGLLVRGLLAVSEKGLFFDEANCIYLSFPYQL